MPFGDQVKETSLKHVQGKAARDTLSAIIEWRGNKISTAKKRWVFELLQNAIDTGTARNSNDIQISIEHTDDKLVFRHNAGWFTEEEIAAVFYGGSTKPFEPDSEFLGRFGTGFLVSYVLSRKVTIKTSFLDREKKVLTCPPIIVDRTGTNETDISAAIDSCFLQLNTAEPAQPQTTYWTEFSYDLNDDTGKSAATDGLKILQECLTVIFAFNPTIKSIVINGRKHEAQRSSDGRIDEVKVDDTTFHFKVQNEISVGLLSINDHVCQLDGIPRIFLGIPLVETADIIHAPFVINSKHLAPTERRDALDSNTKTNEDTLAAAITLYKTFLTELIGSRDLVGKQNCLRIATIPSNYQDQNPLWKKFDEKLKEIFQQILNETPIVKSGDNILPFNQVYFPANAGELEDINLLKDFYDLAKYIRKDLPDWENCAEWLVLYKELKDVVAVTGRIYNITSLKEDLLRYKNAKNTLPTLDELGAYFQLQDAANFFHALYVYAEKLYESNIIHSDFCESLLVSQGEVVGPLKQKWRSGNISYTLQLESAETPFQEEFKDIITAIGRHIRHELVDPQFSSFKIVIDYVREDLTIEKIFQIISSDLYKLKEKVDKWTERHDGWVNLFRWCILNEVPTPDNFPIITKGLDVEPLNRRFLIPFGLMNIDAAFEEIFPDKRILNTKYFDQNGIVFAQKLKFCDFFITTLPTYRQSVTLKTEKLKSILIFSELPTSEEHKIETNRQVISEVPFWTEVTGRISDEAGRAKLLFRFILQYLSEKDNKWSTNITVGCSCSKGSHILLPSIWLAGIKTDKWIPVELINEDGSREIQRRPASKESIEKLFSSSEFEELIRHQRTIALELLPHLGFDSLDLKIKIQSIETGRAESLLRNEVNVLADINQRFPELADLAATDPEGVENVLKELQEQRKRERLKNENKKIGENVELIIRQIVRRHGLRVKNIHKGADMEIWADGENDSDWSSGVIEVDIDNRRYYLESKFTSTSSVHISPAQADSARNYKDRYVILVVKSIPGLRDALKLDMQDDDENIPLQNTIIENSKLIENVFTKLGEPPNNNEVEIDLNGYWIKQALWSNALDILSWLEKITMQNAPQIQG